MYNKGFFKIKQPFKIYAMAIVFLVIDFCSVSISKGFKIENVWIPIALFFKAILFGGIEEIGWRYSFQPCLEKKAFLYRCDDDDLCMLGSMAFFVLFY